MGMACPIASCPDIAGAAAPEAGVMGMACPIASCPDIAGAAAPEAGVMGMACPIASCPDIAGAVAPEAGVMGIDIGIDIAWPMPACPAPDTLALIARQSPVATDSAGRAKSCNTPSGSAPTGASGDAGSVASGGGAALCAPMAGAAPAPHSDSAIGTHHACRCKERNVIERLVVLAMPDIAARGANGSHTVRRRMFIWQTDSWHRRQAYGHTGVRQPVAGQCVRSVRRGNGDGEHPVRTLAAWVDADTAYDPMQGRQATKALGGRSRTATTALVADVRRKGMAVDGWASGKRNTRFGGSAVHTTHAAQAEQLL
ncbi:hypothetical protein PAN31108_00742 [Pandoraea anhela]|uniref:Uncharacterized protein n=1 Tax=Pandoraea anhela TaxID=2508295 RepID=A0A5E4SDA9_9BURK|nr:hypothetical protein PAN31108_00742 [Pandoraea anhela]